MKEGATPAAMMRTALTRGVPSAVCVEMGFKVTESRAKVIIALFYSLVSITIVPKKGNYNFLIKYTKCNVSKRISLTLQPVVYL